MLRLFVVLILGVAVNPVLGKGSDYMPPLDPDSVDYKQVKKVYKLVDIHKAFKEQKRVLIGNYRVAFSVAKSAYAKEQGGTQTEQIGSGGWKTVRHYKDQELRATVELQGVESTDLNAITEKAYRDLISRLEAVGREVVTMDQIADSPAISEHMDTADLDGDGEYWTNFGIGSARELTIVTWPQDTPLWFMMGDVLDAGASYKAAFNALGQKNFGFVKAVSGEQNAALLDISVTVRFADAWSQRAKTLRRAKVGVDPGMTLSINKVGLTTAKVTKIGVFPGRMGDIKGLKKAKGFDLGSDWAIYSQDVTSEESLTATGQTIEMVVTTEPEKMEEAVLRGLTSLNAAIAAIAAENPAKK